MNRDELKDEQEYLSARAGQREWQLAKRMGISRRRLLQLMVAGGALATFGGNRPERSFAQTAPPAPTPVLKPTPPELFYDFGGNKEMRWENMYGRGYVVPNELFFVRNHTRTPRIEVANWRLKIEGSGIELPLEMNYDQLLGLPSVSVLRYVECAGNGRSFFDTKEGKKAQGTQWKWGAIGVAEWTGVPLHEVLERAGLKKSAVDVMPEGLDDLKVRRPMSIGKALEEDTLLVYAMNGQPLPADHGFPARILTPGWIGIANIKWLGRIEVSDKPLFSNWNTDTYVMIGPDFQAKPPAKGPILSTQVVKSAVELPWGGEIPGGDRLVRGRAWSPFGRIIRVEFSVDGGSWQNARLREPNIAKAWVRWDVAWQARPGKYQIRARATDEKGNTQPDRVGYNEQGYLYNGIVEHPVTVK